MINRVAIILGFILALFSLVEILSVDVLRIPDTAIISDGRMLPGLRENGDSFDVPTKIVSFSGMVYPVFGDNVELGDWIFQSRDGMGLFYHSSREHPRAGYYWITFFGVLFFAVGLVRLIIRFRAEGRSNQLQVQESGSLLSSSDLVV